MKKKVLLFVMMVFSITMAWADNGTINGLIATFEGSDVTYQLEKMPTVSYQKDGDNQKAILTYEGLETPIEFLLEDGKQLVITYGTYVPSGINDIESGKVQIKEMNNRKYIVGGKLIIIKNGKKYAADGTEIK